MATMVNMFAVVIMLRVVSYGNDDKYVNVGHDDKGRSNVNDGMHGGDNDSTGNTDKDPSHDNEGRYVDGVDNDNGGNNDSGHIMT